MPKNPFSFKIWLSDDAPVRCWRYIQHSRSQAAEHAIVRIGDLYPKGGTRQKAAGLGLDIDAVESRMDLSGRRQGTGHWAGLAILFSDVVG